jgi:hypothetical protein
VAQRRNPLLPHRPNLSPSKLKLLRRLFFRFGIKQTAKSEAKALHRPAKKRRTQIDSPGFPRKNPPLSRLYLKIMSTPTISVDEFQALEQKVLRAIEIVKREREARATAEAEVANLRAQLAEQQQLSAMVESEINTLSKERENVRLRVEKMLSQMDELL